MFAAWRVTHLVANLVLIVSCKSKYKVFVFTAHSQSSLIIISYTLRYAQIVYNETMSEEISPQKFIHYKCAKEKMGWDGMKYCMGQSKFTLSMRDVFCESCGEQLFSEEEPYTWQSYAIMGLK